MTKEEVKSLINFLDTCSTANRQQVYKKIKGLSSKQEKSQTSTSSTKETAQLSTLDEEPSISELMDVQEVMQSEDQYASTEWASGYYAPFNYNWTVARNLIGLYTVMSKEFFDLADHGSWYDISVRYTIEKLEHKSSYILGYAPGISWQENNYSQYAGIYHAYLSTGGVLSALGINTEKSSSRYVHAETIYTTQGAYSIN